MRKAVFVIGISGTQEGTAGLLIEVQAFFPGALAGDIHRAILCGADLVAQV